MSSFKKSSFLKFDKTILTQKVVINNDVFRNPRNTFVMEKNYLGNYDPKKSFPISVMASKSLIDLKKGIFTTKDVRRAISFNHFTDTFVTPTEDIALGFMAVIKHGPKPLIMTLFRAAKRAICNTKEQVLELADTIKKAMRPKPEVRVVSASFPIAQRPVKGRTVLDSTPKLNT